MRYTYACFENYIGFYNGLGLNKVEIDFSKAKNHIVLISGINGCGKSTLMNALSIFPDPYGAFVPNLPARKILNIIDNETSYYIQIISGMKKSKRETTKAYIQKNGVELNPNGNISSYKEIIFSEFELDSNYISLSKLSANDRGLGDKTPSERKRFVANIINNLEIYNEIYKTLNKKSNVYKSHIKTIHTKIQNIGVKENLELNMDQLKHQEQDIQQKILNYNNQIVSIQTKVSISEQEAEKVNQLEHEYQQINEELFQLETSLKQYRKKSQIKENEIESKFQEDQLLQTKYQYKFENLKSKWEDRSNQLQSINNSIYNLNADLKNNNSIIDQSLELKYNETVQQLDQLRNDLHVLQLSEDPKLIYVIDDVLKFYQEFLTYLDSLYDRSDTELLKYLCIHNHTLNDIMDESHQSIQKMEDLKHQLDELNQITKELSILENRPSDCQNDNCSFIQSAIHLKQQLGDRDIIEEISELNKAINRINKKQQIENDTIMKYQSYELEYRTFSSFIHRFESYKEKFKNLGEIKYLDTISLLSAILNNSPMNDMRDPKRLIDAKNTLLSIQSYSDLAKSLESDMKVQKEKQVLLESNQKLLQKYESEKESLLKETRDVKIEIDHYQQLINSLEKLLSLEKDYCHVFESYSEKKRKFDQLEEQVKEYRSKSDKALEQYTKIKQYQNQIDSLNQEMHPITQQIQIISGQLTLLSSYYQEYEQYQEKYQMIETLKKYCSPTNGGIQTIFMQMYMSKTLQLSNEILQMLFGGEYQLLDFIINSNEFRIPFSGSGLPVDDISNGSASQVCMMSMIINLVLLHQASTKFNIAQLDEMDHALDTRNRSQFVKILNTIIPMLGIDQLFVISHSIEADASLADVIRLKTYSDFDDNTDLGNVIYDYNTEIQKVDSQSIENI